MSRPSSSRRRGSRGPFIRVNGRIRAKEVRVIGPDGSQIGVVPTQAALAKAQQLGIDLVEIAPQARPPVCRMVDFGKYRYEQSKKERENKKHQHSHKLKEIKLSPVIDPHDFEVKLHHAIEFLCEEMKLKVSLRFKGRQMAHTEVGFEVINHFIEKIAPWGQPDNKPRLVGRAINLMMSPLPRNKRAPNPVDQRKSETQPESGDHSASSSAESAKKDEFHNSPFDQLEQNNPPASENS